MKHISSKCNKSVNLAVRVYVLLYVLCIGVQVLLAATCWVIPEAGGAVSIAVAEIDIAVERDFEV